ncbi:hypothetical protein C8J57DRAFT_1297575 [Mycena rebaudengoi]|nr:hypothetical protein C8J57DRAFT_1297575 [Mycena rebaudengoi]
MSEEPLSSAIEGDDATGALPQIIAAWPFSAGQTSTDVIIRSADKVLFHTHKLLLSLQSPFFENMFTLPQSPDSSEEVPQTIDVSEDSNVLANLLRCCDPRCGTPELETFEEIQRVLEAAVKYDMGHIESRVADLLKAPKFVETSPVRVYAIAILHKREGLARLAAFHSLNVKMEERPNPKELKLISAASLQHLHDYFFACSTAARSAALLEPGIKFQGVWRMPHPGVWSLVCPWWAHYMNLVAEKLRDRPSGATVMNAYITGSVEPVKQAHKCPVCQNSALQHLEQYSKLLAAHIDDLVTKVPLVIEF